MEELWKARGVYPSRAYNPVEEVTLTDALRINSVRDIPNGCNKA